MAGRSEYPEDREGNLRLSHNLVALHVSGIVVLFLVVLSSVLWMSTAHNKLAKDSSEGLVSAGLTSLRQRTLTLVRDYSMWDEGYVAALSDDRDWLYSNIGASVTEIGTFDLVLLIEHPGHGAPFGWTKFSPAGGQIGLLPDNILQPILQLLKDPAPSSIRSRTLIAEFNGQPWIFAVSRVTPVAGPPEGVPADTLPIQIHGQQITQDRLDQIGQSILADDLTLAHRPGPAQASVALLDFTGRIIDYVVWSPPRPGASILRQVAFPLALALFIVTVISAVSSHYAVRSARRLESALYSAKAADRSKTEFLSNVSHELRTPMNGILGVAQLLRTTHLDAEQHELLSVLFASANAQMALISDLLDLTRMESGNRELLAEPFEPATVLSEVAEMVRVAADRKQIGFVTDFDSLSGLTLLGDGRALRQIATNLLGNAVKFTDRGRVELRAAAEVNGERVRLSVSVSDTGRGIPAEALPHIFERFYQVDGSLTRNTEGTGLGLAISQRLAGMLGGRIEAQSEPGIGSRFELTLSCPLVRPEPGELDAA